MRDLSKPKAVKESPSTPTIDALVADWCREHLTIPPHAHLHIVPLWSDGTYHRFRVNVRVGVDTEVDALSTTRIVESVFIIANAVGVVEYRMG